MLRDVFLVSGLCLAASCPRLVHPVEERLILLVVHSCLIAKVLDRFGPFLYESIVFGEQAIIMKAGQGEPYHGGSSAGNLTQIFDSSRLRGYGLLRAAWPAGDSLPKS